LCPESQRCFSVFFQSGFDSLHRSYRRYGTFVFAYHRSILCIHYLYVK